ncbi:MAG: hypothetical protein WDW38_006453 [Sanguina aurantia]
MMTLRGGVKAAAFHGEFSQGARTRILAEFKAGELQVLVATDVAARGIDIPQLPVVLNYDLPRSAVDYTHRIGRTGRAGETGIAVRTRPSRGHTFTEVLKDGAITKIYFDFDHVLVGRPREAEPLNERDLEFHASEVHARVEHMLQCLKQGARDEARRARTEWRNERESGGGRDGDGDGGGGGGGGGGRDADEGPGGESEEGEGQDEDGVIRAVIASRHGWCENKKAWKISYRPFILGLRIRYAHIIHILRVTGQLCHEEARDGFWDTSVYKPSEQLLACINGVKSHADPRVLMPGPGSPSPLDYVAQVVEESWRLLTVPAEAITRGLVPPGPAFPSPTRTSSPVSEALLRSIVNGLSATRASDRKEWIEVVWAIGSVAAANGYSQAGEAIAQEFSRRCPTKYSARAVSKAYRSGRPTGGCGLGSLLYWFKGDNVSSPRDFHALRSALAAAVPVPILELGGASSSTTTSSSSSTDGQDEADSRARAGKGVVHATTTAATVRQLLMEHMTGRWPDEFAELNGDTFQISSRGGQTCFTDGHDVHGYIKNFSVFLDDGTFLGLLCDDVPVKGPLSIHRDLPPHVDFLFNRESASHSTLRSVNPPDTLLSLIESETDGKNGVVQIEIKGRRTVNVNNVKKVTELQDQITDAVRAHVESILGPQSGSWFLINNGTIIVNPPPPPKAPSDFSIIRDKLDAYASSHGMRKLDGNIYAPVEGCPCAYVISCTYEEHITTVLRGDELFKSNPRRFDELMKYLTNYNEEELPVLKTDRDLISFSNGVVELLTGLFTPYQGLDPGGDMSKRVARHHIPHEYSGATETPLLDLVLDAQFDREVAEVLCALLGRAMFRVGQLDGWQVMPFLVGIGGTGKSMLMNVTQNLFAPGAVGNLAAKREEVFGMANLLEKEVVFGRDMPAKMSASLPQEIMQSMTAGEGMEIPRKGLTAMNVVWTAPVVIAGNHMPDYTNTGNNVGRRIVTVRFDNVIKVPQEDLQQRIIDAELPNLLSRCLKAYSELRARSKEVGGFWNALPPLMREWRSRLTAATNKLDEYLSMDPAERECNITNIPGSVTILLDFKTAFETRMSTVREPVRYVADPAVFASYGFRVSDRREHTCRACKQLARGGCCAAYSQSNRIQKYVIFDMEISPIVLGTEDDSES